MYYDSRSTRMIMTIARRVPRRCRTGRAEPAVAPAQKPHPHAPRCIDTEPRCHSCVLACVETILRSATDTAASWATCMRRNLTTEFSSRVSSRRALTSALLQRPSSSSRRGSLLAAPAVLHRSWLAHVALAWCLSLIHISEPTRPY